MIEITKDNQITGATYSQSNYQDYINNKNIFEDVIDDLILDKYTSYNEEKEYIKSLAKEHKRMTRLLLMSDNNILWSKIYDIQSSNNTRYNKIKEIILLLRDYVKIADVERKSHGEILTPFKELAKPMVNLMDKYDVNFWKDPTNKVLDSSAGYGTFLILCLYKFMEGLVEVIPNEDERLKHIIENQLYYGELQSKSVFSWLVAIDINDEYNTNIYWGSYLEEGFDYHMKNIWKVDKFDLIIQNPPYQMQKEGFKKTQPLWHLFVQKSLKLLKEDKYMIMVHPSGWRNVDGVFKETQSLLKKYQILELNINDERKGEEMFGATTGFDYYIIKKSIETIETIIISDSKNSTINLSNFEFIPSGNFELFNKLIAKEGEEKVSILHSFSLYETRKIWMSKIRTDEFIHPCCYTIQKDKTINLFYSNRVIGHFGISKVIWSNGKASSPIIDNDGIYGLTQFSYAIVDKPEKLPSILDAMNTKKFVNLMKSCDMNDGNRFNRKILSLFKKDFWKEFV
jgi:hypothetical protein